MKVSHEVPRCLLTAQREFNDYLYCLPHLLDQDEEYKEFFIKASSNGDYIVMDNSLHELGEAYDHQRLLHWVNELQPDEFIVPDVWMDKSKTLVNAKFWKQYKYPEKTTIVAVVQGQSLPEAIECYSILKDLGYKKIAFSYGADWYANLVPNENKDLAKALGRIYTIGFLRKNNIISSTDRIHLLGCSVPQEFGWYKNASYIESIDTSNPIMASIEGLKYTEQGLTFKPKANMNDSYNIDFENIDYKIILHNTQMFRKINGLAYIQNIPGTN